MSDDPVLDRMNLEPRPVSPQFAIAPDVLLSAQQWRLYGEAPYLRCRKCQQAVMTAHALSVAELSACVLAHLMQAHGWTREEVAHD